MTRAEREAYKAWLAELKEGDEVAVVRVSDGNRMLGKVKSDWGDELRIDIGERWPSGYRKSNGRLKEKQQIGPHMLEPVTEELRIADAHQKKVNAARTAVWRREWARVSDAKILRIVAILDEPEGGDRG